MSRTSVRTGACRTWLAGAPHLSFARSGWALAGLALICAFSASTFAANQVGIHLEGDIAPECAIIGAAASSVAIDLGDISKPGSRDYAFTLNCNAPFSYRLEAQYGALTNEGGSRALNGFTAALPYDVAVHIPTDNAPIDDRCTSESLRAGRVQCPFSNSNDAIAFDAEGRLTVAWSAALTLLAGNYTDRLTVTVGIRQ